MSVLDLNRLVESTGAVGLQEIVVLRYGPSSDLGMEALRQGDEDGSGVLERCQNDAEAAGSGCLVEDGMELDVLLHPGAEVSHRATVRPQGSRRWPSPGVMFAIARVVVIPSKARQSSTISTISSQSGFRTLPTRWLSSVIRPSLARSRIASRTGVVLTPSCVPISVCISFESPRMSPRRVAVRNALSTKSTATMRRCVDTSSLKLSLPTIELPLGRRRHPIVVKPVR